MWEWLNCMSLMKLSQNVYWGCIYLAFFSQGVCEKIEAVLPPSAPEGEP